MRQARIFIPVMVDGRYLIKIFNKFKDVRVYVTGGSDKLVYFKFDEGEALLMPMRMPRQREGVTDER